MLDDKMIDYLKSVLEYMPTDWLNLTTHRLDIYNEALAKKEFLEQFEALAVANNSDPSALANLPTAFDYIRLGHPLSCIHEWLVARQYNIDANAVINFSSQITPLLAVLRKNRLSDVNTRILYQNELPSGFNTEILNAVYGYQFEIEKLDDLSTLKDFDGSTILISTQDGTHKIDLNPKIDFYINLYDTLGAVILVNGVKNQDYISEIQHVRRRETIAMTPANTLVALRAIVYKSKIQATDHQHASNKKTVEDAVSKITHAATKPLVGSSGLSIQYAIMMGLVHYAMEHHTGKAIKFIVPPNCYGGTNDQARRVAACLELVEVVDLPVDGGNDMVQSIDTVLKEIALQDAIPYIIAEIPTNPRVEVPDLHRLKEVLSKARYNANGETAIDPVFILDQTFCPNVNFLGEDAILSSVRTISYASGSKFPSGGLCTAGYCVGNKKALDLIEKIERHLKLCDNEATRLQLELLAKQLPSMIQRIDDAYKNTRAFVNYIEEVLPKAKINFVSKALAKEGFTPSVFSLDLPTQGNTPEEKEAHKRKLNHQLINMMITEIPSESKYCVSYGQLKGCYWTIPATSTQGTTKEGDKDYIARVALSPKMDLEKHKQVFKAFVDQM